MLRIVVITQYAVLRCRNLLDNSWRPTETALKVDKVASVARKFGLNESSVREIRKNEKKIRDSVTEGGLLCAKTASVSRDVRIEKTEKALSIWIEDQTRKRVRLSSHIIREKAKLLHKHFSESLGESSEFSEPAQFLASKGWFERFKHRFSLHNVKLVGEIRKFVGEIRKFILRT